MQKVIYTYRDHSQRTFGKLNSIDLFKCRIHVYIEVLYLQLVIRVWDSYFFLQKLTKIALVEIIIILVETHQHFILQGSRGYTFFVQCLIQQLTLRLLFIINIYLYLHVHVLSDYQQCTCIVLHRDKQKTMYKQLIFNCQKFCFYMKMFFSTKK